MDAELELRGRVIAVPETRQLHVLAGLLRKRGATVLRCPLVGIKDHPDQQAVTAWIRRQIASPPQLLVFYTGEGIERLLECARRAEIETQFVALLAATPKLTRGPKPKRALKRLGLEPQHEAPTPTTAGLIAALDALDVAGTRVAVQLYDAAQEPTLVEHLRGLGADVDVVAPYVYASAADDAQVVELIDELRGGRVDAIAFTSKAQVERLRKLARARGLEPALATGLAATKIAAVGPVVADELRSAGWRVDAMPEDSYSMKPLVTALCSLLAPR
jgi:uroporphyrinogen-III synthase